MKTSHSGVLTFALLTASIVFFTACKDSNPSTPILQEPNRLSVTKGIHIKLSSPDNGGTNAVTSQQNMFNDEEVNAIEYIFNSEQFHSIKIVSFSQTDAQTPDCTFDQVSLQDDEGNDIHSLNSLDAAIERNSIPVEANKNYVLTISRNTNCTVTGTSTTLTIAGASN